MTSNNCNKEALAILVDKSVFRALEGIFNPPPVARRSLRLGPGGLGHGIDARKLYYSRIQRELGINNCCPMKYLSKSSFLAPELLTVGNVCDLVLADVTKEIE